MSPPKDHRYEIKYVLKPIEFGVFEYILQLHPLGFIRTFEDRWVNNIYFDTVEFHSCRENLSGISARTKVRYRWYGKDSKAKKGALEFKIKQNQLGEKRQIVLGGTENLKSLQEKVNEYIDTGYFLPSIQNRYLRSYYIDRNRRYRMTIDKHLSYRIAEHQINDMLLPQFEDPRIIVEIKFDKSEYGSFDSFAEAFPFRVSKHSKYVTGLLGLVYT